VPEKFEELFSKFAKGDKTRLTFWELLELTKSQMNAHDVFGRTAEKLEWLITYQLIKDAEGLVSKDHIRGVYDGSLFQTMAKLHKSTKNF
jgi:peroxygenase